MSTPSKDLITSFYGAFGECDGASMTACYAADASFSDPVFVGLRAREVGGMWRMLTSQATDLRIELLDHGVDGERGSAHWQARYTFSQTGRPVVNDVRARFRFADGLISEHVDEFDFYRWARQALGTQGLLLGWTPLLRSAVRKRARASLRQFIEQESQGSA
jgi:ketosteroid isomerase-like protein